MLFVFIFSQSSSSQLIAVKLSAQIVQALNWADKLYSTKTVSFPSGRRAMRVQTINSKVYSPLVKAVRLYKD